MTKAQSNSVLDKHGVKKLSDFAHARQRTEMYFGSRAATEQNVLLFSEDGFTVQTEQWVPALLTAFREIVDNSLDEFKKAGTKDPVLRVQYDEATMSFVISDNGRGIPIDYVHEYNTNVCTMVLTETKTGRNFDDSQRDEVIGQNGLGGSITVIVSSKSSIEIHRPGKPHKTAKANEYEGHYKFVQNFEEGNILFPDLIVHDPKITKVASDKTGTTISFTLSDQVFENRVLPTRLVYSILKEIANANQDYKVYLNDERIQVKGNTEKSLFGVNKMITLNVKDDDIKFNSTFYVVPNAVEDCAVNFHMQGLVNNAPALDGGAHLDAFKKNFALGILTALEKEAKKRKLKPNRADIEEGLLIYNITKMSAPNFASQIKTKLINNTVVKPINAAMTEEYYNDVVKKNKEWVNDIFERCSLRTNKKEADENSRLGKKLLKAKVANLRDATGLNRTDCILYCAEGNSAISNLLAARDPSRQGVLPLRGKIKNIDGTESTAELMGSDALKDLMVSINLIPGVRAVRAELRFGKLFISTDADLDGLNIQALLCNFFYKLWPELFRDPENPFVYVFQTPYIILEKGKETRYFYSHNVDEYVPEEWEGWKPTRAKGLGTLEVEHFRDAFRDGFVIPIVETEEGSLQGILDLIFNKKRADDRKEWMAD